MIQAMGRGVLSWCMSGIVWLLVGMLAFSTAPAPGMAQTTAAENSYTDTTYGYTVTWDGTWARYATPEVDGYLGLDNGVSQIWVFPDTQWGSDTTACLEGNLAQLQTAAGVSGITPLVLNNGAVQGGDAEDAYAAHQYVYTQGTTASDVVEHYRCHVLVPGQAVLVSILATPLVSYGTEVHGFNGIVDTISLPANTALGQTTPVAPATSNAAALDVQAMMLRVDDLDTAGLTGFGGAYRQYRGDLMDADVERLAEAQGVTGPELQANLEGAGLTRTNVSIFGFADLQRGGSPDFGNGTEGFNLTKYVYVYLFEAPDAASAERVFDAVQPISPMHAPQPVQATKVWGDQSVITQMSWIEPDDQHLDIMQVLDMTFRNGNLVGKIQLELPEWEAAPTVAQIEHLTGLMFDRIEGARAGNAPNLSTTVLYIEDPGVTPLEQGYLVLGGSYNPIAGVTTDDPMGTYQTLGAPTHFYTSRQYIVGPSGDEQNGVEYQAAIIVFPDEATAISYLDERLSTADSYLEERAGPGFGDESLHLFGQAENGYHWSRNWVRQGNVIVRINFWSATPVPVEPVDALMELQLICVDAGTCKSIPVPDAIMQIAEP